MIANACTPCRAGWHALCERLLEDTCCCGGRYNLTEALHTLEMDDAERSGQLEAASTVANVLYAAEHGISVDGEEGSPRGHRTASGQEGVSSGAAPDIPATGDSGYIHPTAWAGTAAIGTLTDPRSTGRKRADRMFKLRPGQVCEWARKKVAFGDEFHLVGCVGNPASDIHHGPDKNTLNNAKASWGIGDVENIHLICSECHNAIHALMDPAYPAYDRVLQQDQPWVPPGDTAFTSEEATPDELWEQDQHRERQRIERGRQHRGRNAAGRPGDTSVQPDDE